MVLELRHIVNSKGYSYAKSIAQQVLDEYKSSPKKTNEDGAIWESYCIINWTINQIFGRIETIAGKKTVPTDQPPPLAEVKANANNGPPKRNYRLDPAEPRKRSSAGKRGGKRS